MTLPMRTFEDKVGTRIKLIDYNRMSLIMMDEAKKNPAGILPLLQSWGDDIYQMGINNPHQVHLKQPLKVVS